jgi:hypothetical protein
VKTLVLCGASLLLCSACGVSVEVKTDPLPDQKIPVTSIGLATYAEVAVDLPGVSLGDIQVQDLSADLDVANTSGASTMTVSVRVSTQGTATPGTPFLFSEAAKPPYFNQAVVVLPPTPFPANKTTHQHINATSLTALINQPRLWIIVSNTVTQVGIGDALPLELDLKNTTVHAAVSKSLAGLNGMTDLAGM